MYLSRAQWETPHDRPSAWALVVVQTMRISAGQRAAFLTVTTMVALAGFAVAKLWLPTLDGRLTLVALLTDYADLFQVRIAAWAVTVNALAVVGTVFFIAGGIAIFTVEGPVLSTPEPVAPLPPDPALPDSALPDPAPQAVAPAPANVATIELEERLKGLRPLLNVGTVLLVAAVVEITATLRWPTVFIANVEAQTAMQTAGAAIATAVGALFSVILLSTYVPATILLKRAALRRGLAAPVITALFQGAGFADLANQQTLRLVQALLPLAPGVISTFM